METLPWPTGHHDWLRHRVIWHEKNREFQVTTWQWKLKLPEAFHSTDELLCISFYPYLKADGDRLNLKCRDISFVIMPTEITALNLYDAPEISNRIIIWEKIRVISLWHQLLILTGIQIHIFEHHTVIVLVVCGCGHENKLPCFTNIPAFLNSLPSATLSTHMERLVYTWGTPCTVPPLVQKDPFWSILPRVICLPELLTS